MKNTSRAADLHAPYATPSLILSVSRPLNVQEQAAAAKQAVALLIDGKELHADAVQTPEQRCLSLYQGFWQAEPGLPLLLLPPAPPSCSRHGLSLSHLLRSPDFFEAFLRAALRASAHVPVIPILPCTHDRKEIACAQRVIDRVTTRLLASRIPFDETTRFGLCIGTVEGAKSSRALLEEVDLLFLDTARFSHTVPALMPILELLEIAVGNACVLGRMSVVHGPLATDPRALPHLLAMGADALVHPFYNSDTISDKIHVKSSCKFNDYLL
jgi:hypothetical protein